MLGSIVLTLALSASAAPAEERVGAPGPKDLTGVDPEEVVVYGDAFARWDGTRWFVDTQVRFPSAYPLFAQQNASIEALAVQLRTVIACEKTWKRGNKHYEVDCHLEDVGLQVASWRPKEPHAEKVLSELDALLTQARVQMIVAFDGRLDNVDLEGFPEDTDRQKAVREQARQILLRAMGGFHMKLPPENQLRESQWVEYKSTLFSIPWVDQARDSEGSTRAPRVYTSMGGSYILHQLDKYKGQLVVQSLGEGTVLVGTKEADESFFKLRIEGVSIYDKDSGFMTERVWSLSGNSTASSWLSDGRIDAVYFHNGRVRMLDPDEKVDVGPTRLVAPPGMKSSDLPAWEPLD